MALLDQTQYGSILFAANKFQDVQDITDHFLAEYRKNIADNPRFLEKLKELIQSTKLKVDDLIKKGIANDEKNNYKNPDGSPMEKNDYKSYKWSADRLGFGLIHFPGGSRISMNKINDIEKAFEQFMRKVDDIDHEELNSLTKQGDIKIKLVWKGTPAQFGFIINELIGKGFLEKPTSSYKKDAKIYLEIFDINTTPGTIEKEINLNSNSLSAENGRLLKLSPIDKLQ